MQRRDFHIRTKLCANHPTDVNSEFCFARPQAVSLFRPMPVVQDFWNELFAANQNLEPGLPVEMRLLEKHGRPLLLLPRTRRPALASLSLYPAQTRGARALKNALRCWLTIGAPSPGKKISFTPSVGDPFTEFLCSLAQPPAAGSPAAGAQASAGLTDEAPSLARPQLPTLGMLAGNPASDGQRFLLLVFDASQKPQAVAKVGLSERARRLIEQEELFLSSAPSEAAGMPKLRGVFRSSRLRALALNFFEGDSPRRQHNKALAQLLTSWLDPENTIGLWETRAWEDLEKVAASDPIFEILAGALRERSLHPSIQHGDLAPWNIKVSPAGVWTVLDWERGQLAGLPAWDWFHYVLQRAINVEREPTALLAARAEAILASDAFKQYAQKAGILGCERQLLMAYLLHAVHVIRPSEGLVQTRELLRTLGARWLPG